MNYTEQVFKMLGIEPNEEFMLKKIPILVYRLDDSLKLQVQLDEDNYSWTESSYTLNDILDGTIEIIKMPKQAN